MDSRRSPLARYAGSGASVGASSRAFVARVLAARLWLATREMGLVLDRSRLQGAATCEHAPWLRRSHPTCRRPTLPRRGVARAVPAPSGAAVDPARGPHGAADAGRAAARSRALPEGALWVKRDDRTSRGVWREQAAQARVRARAPRGARGTRRLVTTGGIGTHHGLATTIFARQLGLATTLVLVPQPVTDHVREQLRAMQAFGAEIRGARGVLGAAAPGDRARSPARWLRGERPLLVPTGGSSRARRPRLRRRRPSSSPSRSQRGRAARARRDLRAGRQRRHARGTRARLRARGPALARRRRARDRHPAARTAAPRAHGATRRSRCCAASTRRCRRLRIEPSAFEVTRAQLGAGYGAATPAGDDAAARASRRGLALEPTYTAKCLAEIVARLADGRARGARCSSGTPTTPSDPWRHAPPDTTPAPLPVRRSGAGSPHDRRSPGRGFLALAGSGAAFASLAGAARACPRPRSKLAPGRGAHSSCRATARS